MRDPIQSKLIRLYEAVTEVTLHSSPMIGRSMGMSPEDIKLLEDITALASQARFKLEERLSAPTKASAPVPYAFNAGTNSKGEPAVPAAAEPITEPNGPQPVKKPKVKARTEFFSTHKMWSLDPSLTAAQITEILGVEPSRHTGGKVKYEWDFYVDGKPAGIWDYYDARWSAYGPRELLDKLGLTVIGR